MIQTARTKATRPPEWLDAQLDHSAMHQGTMPSTLAGTLLAIRQCRGALFMLDNSRWLIERWNLASDRLQEQSEDTIRLVRRLLKY
jgi:hypothetical protein